MARKLTPKQIAAGFGGKRRQAAQKAAKSTSRAAPVKRAAPTRKPTMARKKSTRRRVKKTTSLLATAVAANALGQVVEPYVSAGAIQAIQAGDIPAFIASLKVGTKEAVSLANILQAAGPALTLGVMKKLARAAGVTAPKLGTIRAW